MHNSKDKIEGVEIHLFIPILYSGFPPKSHNKKYQLMLFQPKTETVHKLLILLIFNKKQYTIMVDKP